MTCESCSAVCHQLHQKGAFDIDKPTFHSQSNQVDGGSSSRVHGPGTAPTSIIGPFRDGSR